MALRGGSSSSIARSIRFSSIRSSSIRHAPRTSAPPLTSPGLQSRRSFFSIPTTTRNLGALGCTQSLMPLYTIVADSRLTSHISVQPRACCELSQGFEASRFYQNVYI
ncbi:hypothetical protein ACFE04_024293 [Oxalis oulophora]